MDKKHWTINLLRFLLFSFKLWLERKGWQKCTNIEYTWKSQNNVLSFYNFFFKNVVVFLFPPSSIICHFCLVVNENWDLMTHNFYFLTTWWPLTQRYFFLHFHLKSIWVLIFHLLNKLKKITLKSNFLSRKSLSFCFCFKHTFYLQFFPPVDSFHNTLFLSLFNLKQGFLFKSNQLIFNWCFIIINYS